MKVKSRLMVALVAGLMAASSAGVAAQESGASYFEVTLESSGPPDETTEVTKHRNVAVLAGDSRASGVLDMDNAEAGFETADGSVVVLRTAPRLANEEGTWVGEGAVTLVFTEPGPPTQANMRLLFEGEGVYDGLILEILETTPGAWWGVIYPAEGAPAQPDPIQ